MSIPLVSPSSGAAERPPTSAPVTEERGRGASTFLSRVPALICRANLFLFGEDYEGSYVNGLRSGKGVLQYANGNRYEGFFEKGLRHGQGTMTAADSTTYSGEWENGKEHGFGTLVYASGEKYSGQWKNGEEHGFGTLAYANGRTYSGEWEEGVRHGHGLLLYANGDHYEGEWKEDAKHGLGTHVFVNGDRYEGRWNDGIAVVTVDPAHSPIRFKLVSALLTPDSYVFAVNPGLGPGVLTRVFLGFEMFAADPAIVMLQRACDLHCDLYTAACSEIVTEIKEALKHEGKGILYPYRSQSHAMGLGMQRNGDRIEIRVFNSGEGLDKFHYSEGKDFATAWTIQVPYCERSLYAIQKIIEEGKRDPTRALYEKLLAIPECERQTVLPPVLQALQKWENCSIEWIFAYLRNSLPEEKYHRLRIELFKKCLEWTGSEELKAELKRKIDKRKEKLVALAVAGA